MDGTTSLEQLRRQRAHLRAHAARTTVDDLGVHSRSGNPGKSRKTQSAKNMKKSAPPKMKNHAEKVSKWSRNDNETNGNSIKKHVTGSFMKIIKNHISLNGKIIEIHSKNTCF